MTGAPAPPWGRLAALADRASPALPLFSVAQLDQAGALFRDGLDTYSLSMADPWTIYTVLVTLDIVSAIVADFPPPPPGPFFAQVMALAALIAIPLLPDELRTPS